MPPGNRVRVLERVGLASGLIQVGVFTQIGFVTYPNGWPNAPFLLRLVNDSNQDVDVSFDGVTSHDYLISQQTLQIQTQTNSPYNIDCALFPIGTKVYVAGVAGAGTIWLTGYYLQQY